MFDRFSPSWMLQSTLLLAIYLGFFHVCLGAPAETCQIAGVLFWMAWLLVCIFRRGVFANAFEFWIHQLVGLDILLEGFSPLHEGLQFYFCALAFWAVLITYHFIATWPVSELAVSQTPDAP